VHPTQPASDPRAGLVEMRDRRRHQQPTQALVEVAQTGGRSRHPRRQRAGRNARAGDVAQRLAGTVAGQMLKHAQVDAQRAYPGPVLRRRPDPGRELPATEAPALTATPGGDVLDDAQQRALGQIKHLPRLAAHNLLGVSQIGVAALTTLGRMLDTLIRGRDRLKSRAIMTLLAALFASRAAPQTALLRIGPRLRQAV